MAILAAVLVAANIAFLVWKSASALVRDDPLAELPRTMLWAWERPEDLSFLDCEQVGVAYLAETVVLDERRVGYRPRLQPLEVPDGCRMVAVVRIEAGRAKLSEEQVPAVVERLVAVAKTEGLAAIQIDFDALASQRAFYRELLTRLRPLLPENCKLTITALASWCLRDGWIADLPIDDAVPMLFQMGTDQGEVTRHLSRGDDFRVDACRSSLGISTDEPLPPGPAGRRIYIFHPEAWSPEALSDILKRMGALR
ncbi:MAG: DUF3142 domain-containing protein [bacterium]|nr:DUF3142 domain-containing protein [bacterium]